MCGIAGIIGENAGRQALEKMLEVQRHRGPDYTGIYENGRCLLGHNRLSIIDLSPGANQPFVSPCGRFVLVFNGEIYNYKELREQLAAVYDFRTRSDTEVLLAAYMRWGREMLPRLNGMFAFAIWDNEQKFLFAVRDRFGVKPFYYAIHNGDLFFASEIKAFWAAGIPRKPAEKVWASYFRFGSYGMPDETFWEGIRALPGGHWLTYDPESGLHTEKWYFFEEEVKKYEEKLPFDEVKARYENLLLESIRLRFRADVPVGFNISGGLDSSALLAYVNLLFGGENIAAYTFYTGDPRYDELPWVKEMIRLTGNPLHSVLLSPEEAGEKIEEMARYQDEPYGGLPTVAYGNIFEKARENGHLVLLDGQGMDEQWAGYDYYTGTSDAVIQGVRKSPFRPGVLRPEFRELTTRPVYPQPFKDRIQNLQYRDLFYTKIPRALRFNDRASMKSATELREPFLDYRMVEMAFAQPVEYKIYNGHRKYLLRSLVAEHLSDKITYAPKRPLQTPQREWLAGPLKKFVDLQLEKLLHSPAGRWFNADALQKEWHAYLQGDRDSSFHIWQWLNAGMLLG